MYVYVPPNYMPHMTESTLTPISILERFISVAGGGGESCDQTFMKYVYIPQQMCRGDFQYCQEAVDSVTSVISCPTSEEEWESAVRRKNCHGTATQQTCAEPETFLYHCVINEYKNETLEVCAPRRLMTGSIFICIKHA